MVSVQQECENITNQIDSIYLEIDRLNQKYSKIGRIKSTQVQNIHALKEKAKNLINKRKELRNLEQ